jgi:hypothetical protein
MNNYKTNPYEPPTPYFDTQNNFQNYQYPQPQQNRYIPPNQFNPNPSNYGRIENLPTIEMLNLNNNAHPSPEKDKNEYQKITNKIYHIDNHINSLGSYSSALWVMMIWSSFCLFTSMIYIANYDPKYDLSQNPIFEKFNFIVNLIFVVGYIFGIQGYSQQSSEKTEQFKFVIIGFAASNFIFFFIYMFLSIGFFRYFANILFLVINCALYYQNVELLRLFHEKSELRKKIDRISMI